MSQVGIIVAVIVGGIAVAAISFALAQKKCRLRSCDRFSRPDLVIKKEQKQKRRRVFRIRAPVHTVRLRTLDAAELAEFSCRWATIRAQFADHPEGSVLRADGLANNLMEALGYPMADFERRVAEISLCQPVVVEDYGRAHGIALRCGFRQASSEELSRSMLLYGSLFDQLFRDAEGKGNEPE